eukprot:2897240-Pleurochrysis_carterae.AAC.1
MATRRATFTAPPATSRRRTQTDTDGRRRRICQWIDGLPPSCVGRGQTDALQVVSDLAAYVTYGEAKRRTN